MTAWDVTCALYEGMPEEPRLGWFLPETLAYLTHLSIVGDVVNDGGDPVERWALAAAADA
jgi:hypothetical protein